MSIGRNIAELRREKGLTQQALGEKLGVSVQAVSKWENDVCAPDVSLFPGLAELFGVSIDRIFGFRLGAESEMRRLVENADQCESLEENIALLTSGLEKFPNSSTLRLALSMSYLSLWRTGREEKERNEALGKCIRLCREVIQRSGDRKQVDSALETLRRAYMESGEYDRAMECVERLSADAWSLRIVGTVEILRRRGEAAALERFGEGELWRLWLSMELLLADLDIGFDDRGETEKALAFAEAREKLLTLFDAGCPDFFAVHKLLAAENLASRRMLLGDREGCLAALRRLPSLRSQVRENAKSESHHLAFRNPLFFSALREDPEVQEEWGEEFPMALLLTKYDGFLKDSEEFRALREEMEKTEE